MTERECRNGSFELRENLLVDLLGSLISVTPAQAGVHRERRNLDRNRIDRR